MLAPQGLDGIECYHPSHNDAMTGLCLEAAGRYHLLVTGGSDYHGDLSSENALGRCGLNREEYLKFCEGIQAKAKEYA